MSNKYPTEMVTLPSKGRVYPADSPLAKGEIEIKYMTAREEDMLSSTKLIENGTLLTTLFESIVIEKGVNPDDIIASDKDAIIVKERVISFGSNYDIKVTCPKCASEEDVSINLNEIPEKDVPELPNNSNSFKFVTPVSETELEFKLLTHGDLKKLNREIEAWKVLNKNSNVDHETSLRYSYIITAINGERDKNKIKEWISNQFIVRDARAFRKHVASVTPGLDLNFNFNCGRCDYANRIRIPIGIDFFWPDD